MKIVQETTDWGKSNTPNHIYFLDDSMTKMVAYIPFGKGKPFYFKNPITIDKRGRKFEKLKKNPFKEVKQDPSLIEVKGSKGNSYWVDPEAKTCTCPGYTFRGACKHITDLLETA